MAGRKRHRKVVEIESLCQWCAHWRKDANGRRGTCMVLRKIKVAAGGARRGSETVMQTLTTRIETHADDGCRDHFVEKSGIFSAAASLSHSPLPRSSGP